MQSCAQPQIFVIQRMKKSHCKNGDLKEVVECVSITSTVYANMISL